ncbi:MAG: FtsX-like permease family protein [Treponema sp.]|nr:FtsX-like permease family protein [Treponema sp.]
MIIKLALKNILARKSSIVIVLFIAFSVALFVITNSIFDSTENGIQETYVSSFTGDILIRPKNESPLSILGDETPVTGTFSETPILSPYLDIVDFIQENPNIDSFCPLISGFVALEYKNQKFPCIIFGVNAEDYLNIMNAIKIEQGKPFENDKEGIMLSTQISKHLNADIGSDIQFVVARGLSARIRTAPITAIYSYPVENSIFDEIVIISHEIARELLDIAGMYDSDDVVLEEDLENLLSDFDLESMFEEAEDVGQITKENSVFVSSDDNSFQENEAKASSWNFITCKVKNKKEVKHTIRMLNRYFKNNSWPVEAVNWRHAAGSNAMYLYFLRLIMNIGIFIILFAGFIVINNTLIINILDRTCEIGTMRAIGTTKKFVSLECMSETLIISIIAGFIGCLMGVILSYIISQSNIALTNAFLIQLFGCNKLVTLITAKNLFSSFCVSLSIGVVAWIYPVLAALKTSPVVAMQGGK